MATENGSTAHGVGRTTGQRDRRHHCARCRCRRREHPGFPPPASAKGVALVIKTEHVGKVGTVLATGTGLTLYRYASTPAGKATCTGACAKVWPPLLLPKGVTRM